jgi:transposase
MKKQSKPSRTRRSFTPEFRAEAVRIARTPGKTIAQVARELDLTESSLRVWVKQAEVDEHPGPRGPLTTEERSELTRLRRELRTVEMERDFLKKRSGAASDVSGRLGLSARNSVS